MLNFMTRRKTYINRYVTSSRSQRKKNHRKRSYGTRDRALPLLVEKLPWQACGMLRQGSTGWAAAGLAGLDRWGSMGPEGSRHSGGRWWSVGVVAEREGTERRRGEEATLTRT